jgi:polysaccharide deacetylase 2 family uncharacterized protein YibQ
MIGRFFIISEKTIERVATAFWIVFVLMLAVSCGRSKGLREDQGRAFQKELQEALLKGGLADCPVTLATERVNADGDFQEIRHIKIVAPDMSRLEQVGRVVERVARRDNLSCKKLESPKRGNGFILYEVGRGRQRLCAVLLIPASSSSTQTAVRFPADEVLPVKIDLPRYFRGDYRIAIIIDDLGADWNAAESLSKFPQRVTFSILPDRKFTRETAELAQASGKEVMIHLPMEPEAREGLAIGPRTILTTMSTVEVESLFNELVANVPFAVGMNNHMGSKVTPNRALMMEVLTLAKMHNLFFIDSRTTPATQAYAVARELGVPTNFRSVFLDDKAKVGYTEHQLDVLLKRMLEHGSAIAIGHPFRSTIEALQERLPEFERRGVKIVFASDLVS